MVAEAWVDDNFRARLLTDLRGVFREWGVEVPDGYSFRVVEEVKVDETGKTFTLVLPPKPTPEEMAVQYLGFTEDTRDWCARPPTCCCKPDVT